MLRISHGFDSCISTREARAHQHGRTRALSKGLGVLNAARKPAQLELHAPWLRELADKDMHLFTPDVTDELVALVDLLDTGAPAVGLDDGLEAQASLSGLIGLIR